MNTSKYITVGMALVFVVGASTLAQEAKPEAKQSAQTNAQASKARRQALKNRRVADEIEAWQDQEKVPPKPVRIVEGVRQPLAAGEIPRVHLPSNGSSFMAPQPTFRTSFGDASVPVMGQKPLTSSLEGMSPIGRLAVHLKRDRWAVLFSED